MDKMTQSMNEAVNPIITTKDCHSDFTWSNLYFHTIKLDVRWKASPSLKILWLAVFMMEMLTLAHCGLLFSSKIEHSVLTKVLNNNPDLNEHWNLLEKYLLKYGYLSSNDEIKGDHLQMEKRLREAIKQMQKFGNIPQTGQVNTATVALMKRKRCDKPDINEGFLRHRVRRYELEGSKWDHSNLTWTLLDDNIPENLDPQAIRGELAKALKLFSDVAKLNFEEITSSDADIVISFVASHHGDNYPFIGNSKIAHGFFPGEGLGGDVHFNSDTSWVIDEQDNPPTSGYSIFKAAAHEFGHVLGLVHTDVPYSLMNNFYHNFLYSGLLPNDDRAGIIKLYGARYDTEWPVTPPSNTEICTMTFDAISVIKGETYFFKGKEFWKINKQIHIEDPVEINSVWNGLDVDYIDAAYERPMDGKVVFFSGDQYWHFDGKDKVSGYPKYLTNLGLPSNITKVDAAMVRGIDGKTYLFNGRHYWKYDDKLGIMEQNLDMGFFWRRSFFPLDAAFQFTDGQTYFVQGEYFKKFNETTMQFNNSPNDIHQHWFGCPAHT